MSYWDMSGGRMYRKRNEGVGPQSEMAKLKKKGHPVVAGSAAGAHDRLHVLG